MTKRRGKRRSRSSTPARARKPAQAGYRVKSFVISDEPKQTYKPGIEDAIIDASTLAQKGRLEEAKAALQRIIAREPRAVEAHSDLAAVHVMLGDEETAEEILREIAEKFPNYVIPHTNLATIYLQRDQVDEAERLMRPLDRLKHFTPEEFRAYILTWSDLMAIKGDYDAALAWLRGLSKAIPGAAGIWKRRIRYWIGRLFQRG